MSSAGFPLTVGQEGEAIVDLQRRLTAAGFAPAAGAEHGVMCLATEAALRSFQQARGLFATGECDEHTWAALVESGWELGDRQLLLCAPNMRGDDVAELQRTLGRLGFDCGRIDGIFGPLATAAVRTFQTEYGIHADGVCGPDTLRCLNLLSDMTGSGPGVANLRELERLHATRGGTIARTRVAIGQFGAVSSLIRVLGRELRARGASVMLLDEPDVMLQANAANRFEADVYLAFEAHEEPGVVVHFYQVPAFESARGRRVAELLCDQLADHAAMAGVVVGMRLPILRETRMPAIHVAIGPVLSLTDHSASIAEAATHALELWISGRASEIFP